MIPHRWLSVTNHAGPALVEMQTAEGRSPSASGSGNECGSAHPRTAAWSEMGQIDRHRRRGECAEAPEHTTCTGPLDFPTLIDGFVSRRRARFVPGSPCPCLPWSSRPKMFRWLTQNAVGSFRANTSSSARRIGFLSSTRNFGSFGKRACDESTARRGGFPSSKRLDQLPKNRTKRLKSNYRLDVSSSPAVRGGVRGGWTRRSEHPPALARSGQAFPRGNASDRHEFWGTGKIHHGGHGGYRGIQRRRTIFSQGEPSGIPTSYSETPCPLCLPW